MGGCLSSPFTRKKSKPRNRDSIGVSSNDATQHHAGGSLLVSNYRERSPTDDNISRFYSFDKEDSRLVSCVSLDASPSTTIPDGHHEPEHRPRRMLKCGRTGEFYGYRDRIPSEVDIGEHDEDYWWSAANLSKPAILHDMGTNPVVLSRPIKVTVVPSSFFASHRDIEVFPEYLDLITTLRFSPSRELRSIPLSETSVAEIPQSTPTKRTRLIIFKLKMGEQAMVSLNEVIDEETFDRIFNQANRDDLLKHKFKFILSPINSPLPIPAKKPRDAETIGSYFGMDNVDFYLDDSHEEVQVVSILVNIYSKWVIRKFLPLVTASPGRICDFILLSSDDRVVFADFRLLSTEISQALIKGNAPPPRKLKAG